MKGISRGQFIASAFAATGAACYGALPGADALAEAWRLVEEDGACRVVVKDGRIAAVARGRGAGPVLRLLESDLESFEGATVVDSVVGLAAAAAAVKGGAKKVCARTASEEARKFLEANGVALEAKVVVPKIMNRDLTGPCPLESNLAAMTSADAMLAKARAVLADLRARA